MSNMAKMLVIGILSVVLSVLTYDDNESKK